MCSVIPSASGILQVIFVNQSVLELKWRLPAITGDHTHVFYDVDCRKPCEGEYDDKWVDKSCGSDVIFMLKEGLLEFHSRYCWKSIFFDKLHRENLRQESSKRFGGKETWNLGKPRGDNCKD